MHITDWLKANCKFAKKDGDGEAGLPEPWEVSYSPPNPGGSRKKCENCFLWSRDERCSILPVDTHVGEEYVCSYHCHGKPSEKRRDLGATPLTPKLAGLYETDGGTSCDTCEHYQEGKCMAVNGHPDVDAKGCCARWSPKDGVKAGREF
jgi:hypothetical protein